MSTNSSLTGVARVLAMAVLPALVAACATGNPQVGPMPRQGGPTALTGGGDTMTVQFDNPGPHQIIVESVAPDAGAPHGGKASGKSGRVRLYIMVKKNPTPGLSHHFRVTHDPTQDKDLP